MHKQILSNIDLNRVLILRAYSYCQKKWWFVNNYSFWKRKHTVVTNYESTHFRSWCRIPFIEFGPRPIYTTRLFYRPQGIRNRIGIIIANRIITIFPNRIGIIIANRIGIIIANRIGIIITNRIVIIIANRIGIIVANWIWIIIAHRIEIIIVNRSWIIVATRIGTTTAKRSGSIIVFFWYKFARSVQMAAAIESCKTALRHNTFHKTRLPFDTHRAHV